jgi:DNA-binding YbaB/EbfC family protein
MTDVPDLEGLLEQAMQMQQQLMAAQDRARAAEVEGQAGGGAVKVTMTGGGEVTRVRIDAAVVDPAEVDLLEDLVLAALHDAAAKAQAIQSEAMGPLAGLGLGESGGGGLGELGGLGGLLGDAT